MFIYILQSGDRPLFKIGFTESHPRDRVAELQTGNPDLLRLRAWGHGARTVEQALHMWFDDHRVRGEWFEDCPDLRRLIARLNRDVWFGCFAQVEDVARELFIPEKGGA